MDDKLSSLKVLQMSVNACSVCTQRLTGHCTRTTDTTDWSFCSKVWFSLMYWACFCVCVILDVLLQCLGMNFELHRPVIQRSETLAGES